MPKPDTLKDLLAAGHISLGEVRAIAKSLFDGQTTGAGPDGYVITSANWDDLPESCRQFITKAILEFKVENVLDAGERVDPDHSNADSILAERDPDDADSDD